MSLAICALFASSAFAKVLPNVDAFGARKGSPNEAALVHKAGDMLKEGSRIQSEPRLGVPTFLWLQPGAPSLVGGRPVANGPERREVAAARGHLAQLASVYNLTPTDVTAAVVDQVLNTGRGPVIVKFAQQVNGVEIFRENVNLVMNQKLEPIAVTGYISSQVTPAAQAGRTSWDVPARSAAANALKEVTDVNLASSQLVAAGTRDGYELYNLASDNGTFTLAEPVRSKKVWFHLPEGLVPAYYLEVITSPIVNDLQIGNIEDSAYGYVVSAIDGSTLFRVNLISHVGAVKQESAALPPGGFTYKVWADPVTGIPYDTPAGNNPHPKLVPLPDGAQAAFVPMQNVTLPNYPFSMNDPWLAPGATETNGNNVDAYLNAWTPDGFGNPTTTSPTAYPSADHRAQLTGTDQFIHTHTPDVDAYSASARSASITQLFYNINFLHDWFYDAGFNEAAKNAQKNNFGRGGLGNDDIKAQVQDFGGFNNANMLTPADGTRPRMRMYNFPNAGNHLELTAPAGIAGKKQIGVAMSGPRAFDITADIVQATFTTGCVLTNAAALAGKIAMFDFDNVDTFCPPPTFSFSTRISRINATSAVAALMVYSSGAPTIVATISSSQPSATAKPLASISWNNGAPIKTQLAGANTVTARLLRMPDRDGALDNQIVFHEWGHYISGRLIANAAGLNNQQGGSMGEGWGDFLAMLLTVRPDDTATPSNSNWDGVYSLATYATSGVPFTGAANHGYYLGIRRVPYSTDMVHYNALTFKHISDAEALPIGASYPPMATGGVNSEVHNSGEIWTTMLWECYASLLRDTQGASPRLTFQQAQDRMKQYLVASLAMTPASPTYLEARDAVLAAAYAYDSTDYLLFVQAFAKRGAGVNAIAPDRFSSDHIGVVESYDALPDLKVTSVTSDDSVASCDHDNVIDSGDAGKLTVTIKNTGTAALFNTVGTITSTTPGVSFPGGNIINFPASDPLGTVSGQVTVALAAGISGIQQLNFHVEVYDPTVGSPRTSDYSIRGNTKEIPTVSATETVEMVTPAGWTQTFDATLGNVGPFFRKSLTPMNFAWHGPDSGAGSDQRLVSPVFTVDGSGSVNVQFDHSWAFEADASGNYDGGVVEMSVNGGAWTDVGVGYNGVLVNYTGNVNPLKTRNAYVATGSNVHTSITQAVAPGSTVQIRFRIGTDGAAGAAGWDIDNIAFTGVVETPFGIVVADTGCALATTTTLTSSANPSPYGSSVTLTANVAASGPAPTGTVTFLEGATVLGTGSLAGGLATFSTSSLSIGVHAITARYEGATGWATSTSAPLSLTIGKTATTLVLGSSANPSNIGSPVTFTATVSSTAGTPTGSVTFYDGASALSTVALSGGVATYSTSSLTGGSHTIAATYGGTATLASSTNSLSQVITTGSTITFNPIAYYKLEDGGNVTLTVTRTGGNTTGTATVTFATADGTATSGVRYTASTNTLTFNGGETSKTIDIALLDTSAIEGRQTFTVTLSNPNGAVLGAAVATVNIMDDDIAESDFSAPSNGTTDIVWRNEATGDTRVWQMNGTTFDSSANLLQFGGNWRLAAVADFNADGKADILYRNMSDFTLAIWYMNGTNLVSTTTFAGSNAAWQVQAAGDVNGDGYSDILWRNTSTGALTAWIMRDNVRTAIVTLPTVTSQSWQLRGLGDFNRDGKLDLVWRNESSAANTVWLMGGDGTTLGSVVSLPNVSSTWSLVGVGDMNGDGDSDLIWRSNANNNVALWLMNQTALGTATTLPTINDAAWQIVSPR